MSVPPSATALKWRRAACNDPNKGRPFGLSSAHARGTAATDASIEQTAGHGGSGRIARKKIKDYVNVEGIPGQHVPTAAIGPRYISRQAEPAIITGPERDRASDPSNVTHAL